LAGMIAKLAFPETREMLHPRRLGAMQMEGPLGSCGTDQVVVENVFGHLDALKVFQKV